MTNWRGGVPIESKRDSNTNGHPAIPVSVPVPLTALHWLVGLLVLISIGRVHDHVPILAALRPGLLLTVVCVCLALLRPKVLQPKNLSRSPSGRLIMLLGCAVILSTVTGISFGGSASFLLSALLPLSALIFLTHAIIRRTSDLAWLTLCYLMGVTAVALASIFFADTLVLDGYTRQGGVGMYDGNDIAVIYAVGIPLCLVFLRGNHKLPLLLSAAALLLAILSLALSASRGGFLGLVAVFLSILLLSRGWGLGRRLLILVVPLLVLSVLAPPGYWDQMATMLNPTGDYNFTSDGGRIAVWTRGLGYVAQYPVFGIGPDNFLRAEWSLSPAGQSGLLGIGMQDRAAHNTFLQVWAEMGTVGLIIWLLLLSFGIVNPLLLRRRMSNTWFKGPDEGLRLLFLLASYLPASYVGFAVTSFFVSHAFTAIIYVLSAITAGHYVLTRRALNAHHVTRATRNPPGSCSTSGDFGPPMRSTRA